LVEDSAVSISQPLPGIEHVILLMFENRSFDNMLGGFYPYLGQERGGVPPGWSNPYKVSKIPAWQAPVGSAAQTIPYPDPQESFAHMQDQINGPWGPMLGFAMDYATVNGSDPRNIMQYFVAGNVPVTHALAMAYTAGDRYFASGPVQTWPNRLFSICGTPGYNPSTSAAYLNNDEYPSYPEIKGQLPYSSIFEQLDQAGQSWRVYHDDEWPIAALVNYVWEHWDWIEDGGNVWSFDTFFDDVRNNTLPTFSLIEPRYQMYSLEGDRAPTSNHPGTSSAFSESGPPISVSCGERMLAQVFQALVSNPDLFASTLLIVTYDEHGGLFDHVVPPPAPTPFTRPVSNYQYNQYGVRVPTLFINPRVVQGVFPVMELDPPYPVITLDHTSILATLRDQFGLAGSLSPRVDAATNLAGLIDPARQPIIPPNITAPDCVWSPPATAGHAEPILRSMLWRSSLPARRPS
jgi:phospholipase C